LGIQIDNHCNCKRHIQPILPEFKYSMFCSLEILPDTKYRYSEDGVLCIVPFYTYYTTINYLGKSINICLVFTLQRRIITIGQVYGITAHAEIYSILWNFTCTVFETALVLFLYCVFVLFLCCVFSCIFYFETCFISIGCSTGLFIYETNMHLCL